ncbi:hypothetical protein IWW36_005037 [Coemansia brasiliensis]|uniref:Uncharacterized protein n=1 Tax=Coemansia brasiliensis TaxID=2650707 RepID=A0A9W8I766_9FUNG|nr:hypothetical protein IWW36_005037 [Coemansia brasiliensis]
MIRTVQHRVQLGQDVVSLLRIYDPARAAGGSGGNVVAGGQELVAHMEGCVRRRANQILEDANADELIADIDPAVIAAVEGAEGDGDIAGLGGGGALKFEQGLLR